MPGTTFEAEQLLDQVLAIQRRTLGDQQENTTNTKVLVGWTQVHQEKYAAAEATLRDALVTLRRTNPDTWERYGCESILGATLQRQGKYSEAEPLLLTGYGGTINRQTRNVRDDVRTAIQQETGERIVELYERSGKAEKAAEWRQKLQANKTAPPPPKP